MAVKFMKGGESVYYTDSSGTNRNIGDLGRNFENPLHPSKKGREKFEKAFVWNQSPLQMESEGGTYAYGMSIGVYKLLRDENVDAVYIEGARIPFDEIDSRYDIIDPKKDDRFEHATEEQYVIKPR